MWLVQNLRKLLPSLWNKMRCAKRRGADALVSAIAPITATFCYL